MRIILSCFLFACLFSQSFAVAAPLRLTCADLDNNVYFDVYDYFFTYDSPETAGNLPCEGFHYRAAKGPHTRRFVERQSDYTMSFTGDVRATCVNIRRERGEELFHVYPGHHSVASFRTLTKAENGEYSLRFQNCGLYGCGPDSQFKCIKNYAGPRELLNNVDPRDLIRDIENLN